MKKVISAISLLILIASCTTTKKTTSQIESQNSIKSDLMSYLESIINKDFTKSMEYISPEFFDDFPKEQMIKAMEQAYSLPDVKLELTEPKIVSIGKIAEVDGKFYSKLKYSNLINMKLLGKKYKEIKVERMILALEETYGLGNVNYNSEMDSYKILSKKNLIAISENGKSNWKFLVHEEKYKFIFEKFVPEEIWKTQ